jgi:hypothetical protein
MWNFELALLVVKRALFCATLFVSGVALHAPDADACGGFLDVGCNLQHGGIQHGVRQGFIDLGNGLKVLGKAGGPQGGPHVVGGMTTGQDGTPSEHTGSAALLLPVLPLVPSSMPHSGPTLDKARPPIIPPGTTCQALSCPSPLDVPWEDLPEKRIEPPVPVGD